jgi:hypothetical protein
MAAKRDKPEPPADVFRQHIGPGGKVVLDRKLTAEEKAAQDSEHLARLLENRERRFGSPQDWERIYGGHYRDED